ncbi:MAG TPA: hypothetical protein VG275_08130 [Solirubrobacteraceae bacterium]|nr:hypothetical protein [Solirubrobacteraceae bacterium]
MRITHLRTSLVLASASVALLVAGCGGNAPSSTTSAGGPSSRTLDADAYKFSRCMREHGVSNFPDPRIINQPGHSGVGIAVTPALTGSPQFKTAQHACQGIVPGPGNNGRSAQQSAAHLKGLRDFATCMRSHRVPTFPDPNTQGNITPAMMSAAGINLQAPAVAAAATACVHASDGQVNAAAVAQAVHGGSGGGSQTAHGGSAGG